MNEGIEAAILNIVGCDEAIERMAQCLMDKMSIETDSIHISTLDAAQDLVRELLTSASA